MAAGKDVKFFVVWRFDTVRGTEMTVYMWCSGVIFSALACLYQTVGAVIFFFFNSVWFLKKSVCCFRHIFHMRFHTLLSHKYDLRKKVPGICRDVELLFLSVWGFPPVEQAQTEES